MTTHVTTQTILHFWIARTPKKLLMRDNGFRVDWRIEPRLGFKKYLNKKWKRPLLLIKCVKHLEFFQQMLRWSGIKVSLYYLRPITKTLTRWCWRTCPSRSTNFSFKTTTNDDTVDARLAASIAKRFEILFETCLFNRLAFLNMVLTTNLLFYLFPDFQRFRGARFPCHER